MLTSPSEQSQSLSFLSSVQTAQGPSAGSTRNQFTLASVFSWIASITGAGSKDIDTSGNQQAVQAEGEAKFRIIHEVVGLTLRL